MRNCGQQRSISTAIIVRSRNSLHPQWVVRYFFYRKRNGMPEISKIFWEISSYNGKIFLTKNMLFTLCLKPLRRNLILGKQNNTRGLFVKPSDRADTDGGLFVLKISSYQIGKCVRIMCSGRMCEHASRFIYRKNILILIQNLKGRKIARNKLFRSSFRSFQTDLDFVTGKDKFCDPAADAIFLNAIRKKFGAADLLFCQVSLSTKNLTDGRNG